MPHAASNQPAPKSPLDLNAALARLGGDHQLLRDLIGFFFEDSPPLLERVERGVTERDAKAVERSAHSLKGLAANFDAKDAVQAALRLEKLGHSGNLATAPEAIKELRQEIASLREELALFLAQEGGAETHAPAADG